MTVIIIIIIIIIIYYAFMLSLITDFIAHVSLLWTVITGN